MPVWTEALEAELLRVGRDDFAARYPTFSRDMIRAKHNRLLVRQPVVFVSPRFDTSMAPFTRLEAPDDTPEDEDALDHIYDAYKAMRNAYNGLGEPTRIAEWHAPVSGPIGICFIGDIHMGGNIELELLDRDLALVRETPGLYTVYMGDLVDNYKHQAKSGSGLYEGIINDSSKQVGLVLKVSRPLAERKKIIAVNKGNHEEFDGKYAGIDRTEALASELGAVYFTEAGGSIFVYVGGYRYHIICKHQFRGGKRNGANLIYNEWPWTRERPDVVTLAHLHEPSLEQPIRNGEQVTYLRGGTYKIHDEYAASKGYRCYYGVPMVVLMPDERKVIPFMGESFLEGVRFLNMVRAEYEHDGES